MSSSVTTSYSSASSTDRWPCACQSKIVTPPCAPASNFRCHTNISTDRHRSRRVDSHLASDQLQRAHDHDPCNVRRSRRVRCPSRGRSTGAAAPVQFACSSDLTSPSLLFSGALDWSACGAAGTGSPLWVRRSRIACSVNDGAAADAASGWPVRRSCKLGGSPSWRFADHRSAFCCSSR